MILLPKPQKFQARLTSIEKVSSRVYLEHFELIEPREITFLPGQTVMLYVAPGVSPDQIGVNRSMSVASPPVEKNSILLAHDVGPGGVYSQWALRAKVGDPMSFMGPLGGFVLDRESPRKKIFVATGTGIAPFRSMILDRPSGDITLYWGLRHEEDIFWQKELEEFSSSHPTFMLVLTISQATDNWQGKRGHVQDYVFADENNLKECDVYLCGNRQMVDDMKTRLQQIGVPPAQIKFELFY